MGTTDARKPHDVGEARDGFLLVPSVFVKAQPSSERWGGTCWRHCSEHERVSEGHRGDRGSLGCCDPAAALMR